MTPIGKLEEMVNIGTLAAFTLVSIAVVILRRTQPDLERPFKVPFAPFTPILSAIICVYMMLNLSIETWARFIVWMVLGFVDLLRLRAPQEPGRRDGAREPFSAPVAGDVRAGSQRPFCQEPSGGTSLFSGAKSLATV